MRSLSQALTQPLDQFRFLLTDPTRQEATWATGIKKHYHAEGPHRFEAAMEWIKIQCMHTNDRFLIAATFEEEGCIPALTVVLPQYSEKVPLPQHLLEGYPLRSHSILHQNLQEPGGDYAQAFAKVMHQLTAGLYEKIVLACRLELVGADDWDILSLAQQAWMKQTSTSLILWDMPGAPGYIAATPESLGYSTPGYFYTEALAGTTRPGTNLTQHQQLQDRLRTNPKERLEHQYVINHIQHILQSLDFKVQIGNTGVRSWPSVQHLHTPIQAAGNSHILQIISRLNPTPAVCGYPVAKSYPHIQAIEGFARGYYTGTLGWATADGEGYFVVGLRGLHLLGSSAWLHAGSGLVKGSNWQQERAEIDLKIASINQSLLSGT